MNSNYLTHIISDVYRLKGDLSPDNIENELKEIAINSPRKQSRICFHKNDESKLQIMYICHLKNCNVKIHQHQNNPEWIFFLNAKAKIIYFDSDLNVKKIVPIDTSKSNGCIMHFIPTNILHTLEFEEDSYFLEIKQGPFDKQSTTFI